VSRKAKKDPRRRARESALQILYQWEVGQRDVAAAADTFFSQQWPDVEPPSRELRMFASTLAIETVQRLEAIDPLIAGTTERWRPERMPLIDRLILRMAVCELMRGAETARNRAPAQGAARGEGAPRATEPGYGAQPHGDEAPAAVVINEALELARTFSSEESVKFINGMLDAIRKKLDTSEE
jgi:transcription antitermination protein NusB